MAERNALVELAERMKRRIEHHRYVYEIQRQDDVKAHRIIAELAKVRVSSELRPNITDLLNMFYECRAIAEEGES